MCIDIQKIIRWEKGRELLRNTVQIESHEFIKRRDVSIVECKRKFIRDF